MPQPRARSSRRRSDDKPDDPNAPEMSQAEVEALMREFDIVDPHFVAAVAPSLAADPRAAARAPQKPKEEPAPTPPEAPGSHYFASVAPLDAGDTRAVKVQAAGVALTLQAGAGTFSKSELDEGTAILLDAFADSPAFEQESPRWCDLGCGWGAVSCILATAKSDAQVLACDINRRAVALCALNARELELSERVAAWNGDGLGACRPEYFDAILCNPPIRAGNAVIESMFEGALHCLKSGGELWIVVRTSQGAKSWQKKLAALFGACETVEISKGYRVLRAAKSEVTQ